MIFHFEKSTRVSFGLASLAKYDYLSKLTHQFKILVIGLILSVSVHSQHSNTNIKGTGGGTSFIENKGQVHDQNNQLRPDIIYYGASNGFNFHLTNNGLHYSICKYLNDTTSGEESYHLDESNNALDSVMIYRVDVTWLGANPLPEVTAHDQTYSYENYYNTPNAALDGLVVKSYKTVCYKNLYPGIDLRYFENALGNFEYDLLIHPGADPNLIKFKIEGGELSVSNQNELIITTPLGEIIEGSLRVLQDGKEINSHWIVDGNIVTYSIASYDDSRELIIDPPVRIWGTYYGGSGSEYSRTMTDHIGNVYLTGQTNSATSIATTGAHQVTFAGNYDAFLIKFNCAGMRIWGTYFGGLNEDRSFFSDVDSNGNIFVSGWTNSATGISTPGSHQPIFGGIIDGFLARFTSAGQLVWSTYYGGTGGEYAYSCKVDSTGYIYLTGNGNSATGIATSGTHQPNLFGAMDAYLVKFDSDGTRIWGTYLGGEGNEQSRHVVIRNQSILCVGNTQSSAGIATSGAHQEVYGGGTQDGFLASFDFTGQLEWSTYYGGAEWDYGFGCSVDKFGNIYYSGNTHSTDNISTPGCYQPLYGGGTYDAVLVKFDSTGVRKWGTYFGGTGVEGAAFGVNDATGNRITITGSATATSNISTLDGHQPTYGGGVEDAFIAEFDSTGNLIWGSYYGGTGQDNGTCIAINDFGTIYVAGNTPSATNISTPGAHQVVTDGANHDGFLVKFNSPCSNTFATINIEACNYYVSPSQNYTWTTSGIYNDWIPNASGCDSILTIDLIIHDTDTSFIVNECAGYTLPSGSALIQSSGTYMDTLASVYGCDSLLLLTVNINNSYSFINASACDYLVSPSMNFIYTYSGTYLDTISNSIGCDSVITIDLIINAHYDTTVYVDTCQGIFSPGGSSFYAASGIYLDTLLSINGCDSVITTDVVVTPPNTNLTVSGVSISAEEAGLNYQWIDCNTGLAIIGQINQTFTATIGGDYAVIVSDLVCYDTSICVKIDFTNFGTYDDSQLVLFPNPTTGVFNLVQTGTYSPVSFQLTDLAGHVVMPKSTMNKTSEEIVIVGSAGVYFLEVYDEHQTKRFIIVKI